MYSLIIHMKLPLFVCWCYKKPS